MPLSVEEIYDCVCLKYQGNKRLKHILGVANLASDLALKFGLDSNKAYIAGLLHDYIKYESTEEMIKIIKDPVIINKFKDAKEIYHAYASAVISKEEFKINDEEILNAIRYHVYGRVKMTLLEKILVLSDYAEDSREYPSCKMVRRILDSGDFDLALYLCLKYTIDNLVKNEKKPMDEQYEILNELGKEIRGMDILKVIKESLEKVSAFDVKAYDLRGISPLADFVVVASVSSNRQANACIDYISLFSKDGNLKIKSIEGKDSSWVLVDMYDVILHVFTEDERNYYALDKLYNESLAFDL